MPGQLPKEFCPPVQPQKEKIVRPCPRNLTHVEWLVEKSYVAVAAKRITQEVAWLNAFYT